MRSWIRAVLCCLAALSLPLQAAAHDTLRACHGRLAPATTILAAEPAGDRHGSHAAVERAGSTDGGHAAQHGHAPDASGGVHDATGPAGAVSADAACALCAACGVASALPPGDVVSPPAAAAGHAWSAAPAARVERATVRGPERPPRGLAV
jgi:hypothetical protein